MRKLRSLVLTLYLASAMLAANKDRVWQTGMLLNMSESSTLRGFTNSGENGTSTAINRVDEVYTIDSGDVIYVSTEKLKWRWSKPADLIVNKPVKFVVDGKKLFVLDENGKEHETKIQKRTAK